MVQNRLNLPLKELEERYLNALDHLLDGVAIFTSIRNEAGKIIDFYYEFINNSGCLLIQSSKEDLVGKRLLEIWVNYQESWLFKELVRVVETGQPFIRGSLVAGELFGSRPRLNSVYVVKAAKFGDGFFLTWRDIAENQTREQMLQKRNKELVLINSASKAFNSTLCLDQVLQRVLEILTPQLGEAASFWLVDPHSEELVCREASGPSAELVRNWRLKPGEGIAGWVAQTGESLIVDDVLKDDRFSNQVTQTTGFMHRSMVSVPLKSNECVIGVLQVLGLEVGDFEGTNLALIESIASFAAIAVENARLFEESQKMARQTSLLNEITQAAISANNMESMVQILVDRLGDLFSADDVFITFWDEALHRAIPVASFNSSENEYSQIKVDPSENTLTRACLEFGRVLAVEDFPNTPLISERIKSLFSLQSILGLPLISDGRKIGAVLIGYKNSHRFTDDEICLGERTAAQVALALQKANLLGEISKLAITDELTGLYNRRGFILLADQQIKLASRVDETLVLFFIDMDGLKGINDSLGHQYGDSALIEAAGLIRRTFRSSDILGRVGGDEFCILGIDISRADARQLIKRFQGSVEKLNSRFSHPYQLSMSTGFACWSPKQPCSIEELIVKADAAMYKDKKRQKI